MIKLTSKSMLVQQAEDAVLREHLERLVEQEEQKVKELLQKQQQKEERIQAVQRNFIDWAGRKELQLRQRLQKHTRNKEEHLTKIVKKCREHEKFLGEKLKTFQTRKKASLREAWKRAEKYKNSMDNLSKQPSRQRSHSRVKASLAQSRLLPPGGEEHREYLSVHYNNPNLSKVYGNASKDYWAELNQSVRQLKFTQQPLFATEPEERPGSQKGREAQKLQATLARWKQHSIEAEQAKIQQLGERLQRIERGRLRKFELVKKKREKPNNHLDEDDDRNQRAPKRKAERSQRVHSQVMMRERRVHDYSELNKHKREQHFQAQLQSGTDYLQAQKIKFLKATLAKKVAGTAIEKKLYYERLNH